MEIKPSAYYNMTSSAKLMHISRAALYQYIKDKTIKTEIVKRNGKNVRKIKGIEIIKYNNNRIYTIIE